MRWSIATENLGAIVLCDDDRHRWYDLLRARKSIEFAGKRAAQEGNRNRKRL
jgi:hypothetical protein